MSHPFSPAAPRLILPVTVVGPRRSYAFRCTLDAGAEQTVLPTRYLRQLGFALSHPVGHTTLRGTTGIARAPLIRVPALSAIDRVRTEFMVVAHDLPLGTDTDGLLGLDFLRGFVLRIDFARGRITLDMPRRWWPLWH
jgi:hypothetical protein